MRLSLPTFVFRTLLTILKCYSFEGRTSETEKLSGHITSSVNYPYSRLVNAEIGTMREPRELVDFLKTKHIGLSEKLVCVSGKGN